MKNSSFIKSVKSKMGGEDGYQTTLLRISEEFELFRQKINLLNETKLDGRNRK